MSEPIAGEVQTAGKRVRVVKLYVPSAYADSSDAPTLEGTIQGMADEGYNFAGLIGHTPGEWEEHFPIDGGFASRWYRHGESSYLFIKATP